MNPIDASDGTPPVNPADRGRARRPMSVRSALAGLVVLLVLLLAMYFGFRAVRKPPPKQEDVAQAEVYVPPLGGPQAAPPAKVPSLGKPRDEPIVEDETERVPPLSRRGEVSSSEPKKDRWASARAPGVVYDALSPNAAFAPRESSPPSESGLIEAPQPTGGQMPAPRLDLGGLGGLVQAPQQGARADGRQFADRLRPAQLEGTMASRIANPTYTITKMRNLGKCRIEQAINTELPGMISCVLANEVRGADGKVVLMTPASRVVGEYHSGPILGEERFFAIWTRYEDLQTHVIITLDSPATDSLGRAGIGGTVDTKALQRFGPPILFSVLTDLPQYLASRRGGGGTTFNAFSNTQGASQEALRSIIDVYSRLNPTLTKEQGGVVSIFSARDLDFSAVYPLRARRQ